MNFSHYIFFLFSHCTARPLHFLSGYCYVEKSLIFSFFILFYFILFYFILLFLAAWTRAREVDYVTQDPLLLHTFGFYFYSCFSINVDLFSFLSDSNYYHFWLPDGTVSYFLLLPGLIFVNNFLIISDEHGVYIAILITFFFNHHKQLINHSPERKSR